ncbi:glycosyltransferase [Novosphingobium sp. FSY-8]|uniref:Glycosyltransferase n=1 Tax=Novosphingobium ovatum TaxID=1908523 RepID=A0ABW9XEZ2_9SPHN|nr:glycosyltransferase [Novosphingobium ovatum]NBC37105.1 glycosyltransferase [Novosphingobium ovatum]
MPKLHNDLLICDLTQSYAPTGGGGVSTYLREKRRHVLERTPHRLLQIVPGPEDRVVENGRHIWVEVAAKQVRGSPNYRFILRTAAVRAVLERYRPDVIESLCPWVLPWTAIGYRNAHPECTLVAGYHTDFPNVHIHRVGEALFGRRVAHALRKVAVGYAGVTYGAFDRLYALNQPVRDQLAGWGIDHVDVLSLGADTDLFSPARRDPGFRASLGLPETHGPLLTYAGRIDNEKRADRLIEMFRRLPPQMGAVLAMFGDGKLRDRLIAETRGMAVALPGFVDDRRYLARALASSDIYVSAMADETFGISVIEAQAAGLPVVGVASGAMPARVPAGLGYLGPVDDVEAMAAHVQAVWAGGAAAMGARARAHVVERFSWERTFNRLLADVYPAAMARAAQRRQGRWQVAQTQGPMPALARVRAVVRA